MTTGGSALNAAKAIRAEGGEVIGALTLVDREEGAREALAAEGILNRAQPDAIFYQLRDRNCQYLREVIDALDMSFHLSEICGEKLPEPGTDEWRIEIFSGKPSVAGSHHVSLDWWILEQEYPWDGTVGTVNFAHYCNQVFQRAHVEDVDPIPMDFLGKRLFLLVGRFQNQFELRGVLPEKALVEQLHRSTGALAL